MYEFLKYMAGIPDSSGNIDRTPSTSTSPTRHVEYGLDPSSQAEANCTAPSNTPPTTSTSTTTTTVPTPSTKLGGLQEILRPGYGTRFCRNITITAGCGSIFGGLYAIVKDAPSIANYALRTGFSWMMLSGPFFALREIMHGARENENFAQGVRRRVGDGLEASVGEEVGDEGKGESSNVIVMDELKDSGAAGLLTGYFGALWAHGPKFGKLAQWAGIGMVGAVVGDVGVRAFGQTVKYVRRRSKRLAVAAENRSNGIRDEERSVWETWSTWWKAKEVDLEYQDLLRRKAIVEAELEEERRRIRALLRELERKEQLAAARRKMQTVVPSSPISDVSNGDIGNDE